MCTERVDETIHDRMPALLRRDNEQAWLDIATIKPDDECKDRLINTPQGDVVKILADPYQAHRSVTTLQAAGIPIREFPQTTGNCTLMG